MEKYVLGYLVLLIFLCLLFSDGVFFSVYWCVYISEITYFLWIFLLGYIASNKYFGIILLNSVKWLHFIWHSAIPAIYCCCCWYFIELKSINNTIMGSKYLKEKSTFRVKQYYSYSELYFIRPHLFTHEIVQCKMSYSFYMHWYASAK